MGGTVRVLIRYIRMVSVPYLTYLTTLHTCGQDGHYANQRPTKDKGKTVVVNMVTIEVQQVTTRSKAK